METEVESVGKFLSHDGRMISTRYWYLLVVLGISCLPHFKVRKRAKIRNR